MVDRLVLCYNLTIGSGGHQNRNKNFEVNLWQNLQQRV